MVMNPVISQTPISQPALPTFLTMSALTMKIPEPIMEPATIIVASQRPSTGLKLFSLMRMGFDYFFKINFSPANVILLAEQFRDRLTRTSGREWNIEQRADGRRNIGYRMISHRRSFLYAVSVKQHGYMRVISIRRAVRRTLDTAGAVPTRFQHDD